ncbi:class I SAM-dependent methyltransferase [Geobacillus stearothermophilus]|uniref:class I SAM-dependent methyltransferase n=2 Tax=Geobacillus stearothermophilus TaxID=1422 RepID=UPI0005191387|nr:class I SAM-dependent methyltransferase [Geobacillus stearothermophilus]KOR92497.1 rRNA methyltransferase [Geobacillus stearothermophilus ATCC 12980]MED3663380.1 class I SAM-dependent methyltransferase [Geobacillus stearothermophilus]MED3723739.1 class I SAM-dependent methyltransferase [Geobacillus stearothermophilus]MED3748418.1 class I SAM-dependent methyltransferase [Geobacillus stearothermophilus]MED3753400.1 class I SAM-dependent methyltransferase [Geobacillus stearothermophilus]
MAIMNILPFARFLLDQAVNEGDIAVDATVGNGHDTVFLAELVGERGHVFGFDIQAEAIATARARLAEHGLDGRVTLFQTSHSLLLETLPDSVHGRIAGAVFNLGYLPGGNKQIATQPESTIQAVEQLLSILKPGGIIVLVVYHGHPEGKRERDALLDYVRFLDQRRVHALKYEFINRQNNPPFLIALENRADGSA